MKVLFNDFAAQYQELSERYNEAFARVMLSGWYILGQELLDFEQQWANYIGVKHCIGVANGLEALQLSLLALGVGVGDEVITTANSAVATTLAITAVGAKPVFVDIDECGAIAAEAIEAVISSNTKAVMPVHIYGQSAQLDVIKAICDKHRLFLIEDCAQAHGATFAGRKVGSYGDVACFSFYPTKNLGAFGDAGAIVTNDSGLADKCRQLRNYGQKNRYEHELKGLNSRLDEVQAALLKISLSVLDSHNAKRNELAALYRRLLSGVSEVSCLPLRSDAHSVYHLFVVRAVNRQRLQRFLADREIQTLVHYPIPIHKQSCFPEYNHQHLSKVEAFVEEIISLPINPYLSEEQIIFVVDSIKEFYAKA